MNTSDKIRVAGRAKILAALPLVQIRALAMVVGVDRRSRASKAQLIEHILTEWDEVVVFWLQGYLQEL